MARGASKFLQVAVLGVVLVGAPGAAQAATISASGSDVVYSGGEDHNEIRVLAAVDGDLRFEERNEDVVVDNQNSSCTAVVTAIKTEVQCETDSDRFVIEGEGLGDSVTTGAGPKLCGATGFSLRINGGGGSDRITGDDVNRDVSHRRPFRRSHRRMRRQRSD